MYINNSDEKQPSFWSPHCLAADLIADQDEAWFEDHPGRVIYLRWATDGDLRNGNTAILVFHASDREWLNFPFTVNVECDVWPILHGAPHGDADLAPMLEHAIAAYFANNKAMVRALKRQLRSRLGRAKSRGTP